eukprot:5529957-Pleurochrysis_carterae.AAC.1
MRAWLEHQCKIRQEGHGDRRKEKTSAREEEEQSRVRVRERASEQGGEGVGEPRSEGGASKGA